MVQAEKEAAAAKMFKVLYKEHFQPTPSDFVELVSFVEVLLKFQTPNFETAFLKSAYADLIYRNFGKYDLNLELNDAEKAYIDRKTEFICDQYGQVADFANKVKETCLALVSTFEAFENDLKPLFGTFYALIIKKIRALDCYAENITKPVL